MNNNDPSLDSDNDVTVGELMGSLGSANHKGGLTPPETQEILAEIHPAVMVKMVRRWATARDELGGSSAEHPQFRQGIENLLENYPDGYD